jgi:hypothetical protein
MPDDFGDMIASFVGTEKSLEKVTFGYEAHEGSGQFLLTTLSPMGSWIADGTWEAGHAGLLNFAAVSQNPPAPSRDERFGWLECTGRFLGYHASDNYGKPGLRFRSDFTEEEIAMTLTLSRRTLGGASGSLSYSRFGTKEKAVVDIYGTDPIGSEIFLNCYGAPFWGSSMTLQLTYFD